MDLQAVGAHGDRYPNSGRISFSFISIVVTAVLAVLLAGCTPPPSEVSGENTSDLQKASLASRDMNRYPMNKIVCDPLEGGGAPSPPPPQNGIAAELAYLPPATAPFSKSLDFFTKGMRSTQQLFFQDLNVPTRMFNTGFSTQTSDVVKNDMGEKLIENFGLRFKTTLKLVGEQSDGLYEIAVLSDDGTTITLGSGETQTKLIDNEGDHPTRMGCASNAVSLSRTTARELEVTYYQGPRYHISLILMWRKLSGTKITADQSCGKTGNELFFDPNKGSVPLKEYSNLLARGWSPIPKENYFLPAKEDLNPCTPGLELAISNFKPTTVTATSVSVSWTTNRPSTTQALVTDTLTGEQFLTASDQTLTLQHSLNITGLTTGHLYRIQGLSVAEDGGRAISSAINVEPEGTVICMGLDCTH